MAFLDCVAAPLSPLPEIEISDSEFEDEGMVVQRTGRDECVFRSLDGRDGLDFVTVENRLRSAVLQSHVTRNVIECSGETDFDSVFDRLIVGISGARSNGSNFIIAVPHYGKLWPHIHVWHDCPRRNRCCECSFLNPFRETDTSKTRQQFAGRATIITQKSKNRKKCRRPITTASFQSGPAATNILK